MKANETGAPTHKSAAIPATRSASPGAPPAADQIASLEPEERRLFAQLAERLIPAAHGMPSAGEVVDEERLRFVLSSRPDLLQPLRAALRPELDDDPQPRLETLERDEPVSLAALQLVIVGGYYTDRRVRELIGYGGQEAIEVRSWELPAYLEEGLIDAVFARGPVWRDPATGQRAENTGYPVTYAERWLQVAAKAGGQDDGRDGT